jgi:prolyl-tRNA editing enzyme YbaK/EbsC (Cys-tRNA(Pro) deacylase)
MQPHEQVQAHLDRLAPGIKVHLMPESTATAPEAAVAAGCELGAIVKSLLFVIDGQPVLVLVAGDQVADQRKLGGLYGVGKKKVRIADAETVRRVTGFEVGGVPPVGHTTRLPVLIDQTLGRFATVWAAAGTRNAIFPIPFSRMVEITAGRVADIVRQGPAEPGE